MNFINEVYIAKNYPHGQYLLDNIDFHTERQNKDDIHIVYDGYGIFDENFEGWYHFRGFNPTDDITKYIRISYDEKNTLKSVEILENNIFYPYIYDYSSKEEYEKDIDRCIELFSEDFINGIKKVYNNEPIRRIFTDMYLEHGNCHINMVAANETAFNDVIEDCGEDSTENSGNYSGDCMIDPSDYTTQTLNCLTFFLIDEIFDINEVINMIISGVEKNISKEIKKLNVLANDFKFIRNEYD